jgi:glycosyltransferase involved in cell wall biosynthesis
VTSSRAVLGGLVKVAYLVNAYPRTSHSFIRREIRALESLGVEVLRYSLRPLDEPLITEADREEYERTRVILSAGFMGLTWAMTAAALGRPLRFFRALSTALDLGRRSERGLLRHVAYLAEAAVLERWLRGTGVTHLHAHFGTNTPAVALLCRCLGGPSFSFTIHGPALPDEYENAPGKVSHAAFVIAISSFGRAQLYRRLDPGDWSKIHEVHCGVDDGMLTAPLTPVPEAPRLVCVARLHVDKGHLVLLEAASRLAAEGMRFEIVLVGDGPLRSVIEERVRRLGLEGRVKLAGWMSAEQVREAILASRVLVLPSFNEGLPVSLMEALALGRPVISTAIQGIPELVMPGTNGWLVPAGSVEALVPAMREALEAPPTRLEAMGRAGAALVAELHDARREARKLLGLFQSVNVETARLQTGAPARSAVDGTPPTAVRSGRPAS